MKKNIIIGILIVVGIISSLVGINYFDNRKSLVNKPMIDKDSKNTFAIYLSNGNGGYTESQSNSIPTTGYILNYDRSMCLDLNGEVVDNVLNEPVQGKIIVNSNKTLNCYLYYDQGSYQYWNSVFNSNRYQNNETLVNNRYNCYIKTKVVGSEDVTSEVCTVFTGTEYCLGLTSWDNVLTYKSELEVLGATCNSNYEDTGMLSCGTGGVTMSVGQISPFCSSNRTRCGLSSDGSPTCESY